MTLRQHMLAMNDFDAEAAADLLERDIWAMPIDSGCGEECKAVVDATLLYCKAVDSTGGFPTPEARWEVWSRAVRVVQVYYFG